MSYFWCFAFSVFQIILQLRFNWKHFSVPQLWWCTKIKRQIYWLQWLSSSCWAEGSDGGYGPSVLSIRSYLMELTCHVSIIPLAACWVFSEWISLSKVCVCVCSCWLFRRRRWKGEREEGKLYRETLRMEQGRPLGDWTAQLGRQPESILPFIYTSRYLWMCSFNKKGSVSPIVHKEMDSKSHTSPPRITSAAKWQIVMLYSQIKEFK